MDVDSGVAVVGQRRTPLRAAAIEARSALGTAESKKQKPKKPYLRATKATM